MFRLMRRAFYVNAARGRPAAFVDHAAATGKGSRDVGRLKPSVRGSTMPHSTLSSSRAKLASRRRRHTGAWRRYRARRSTCS